MVGLGRLGWGFLYQYSGVDTSLGFYIHIFLHFDHRKRGMKDFFSDWWIDERKGRCVKKKKKLKHLIKSKMKTLELFLFIPEMLFNIHSGSAQGNFPGTSLLGAKSPFAPILDVYVWLFCRILQRGTLMVCYIFQREPLMFDQPLKLSRCRCSRGLWKERRKALGEEGAGEGQAGSGDGRWGLEHGPGMCRGQGVGKVAVVVRGKSPDRSKAESTDDADARRGGERVGEVRDRVEMGR